MNGPRTAREAREDRDCERAERVKDMERARARFQAELDAVRLGIEDAKSRYAVAAKPIDPAPRYGAAYDVDRQEHRQRLELERLSQRLFDLRAREAALIRQIDRLDRDIEAATGTVADLSPEDVCRALVRP